MHDNIASLAAAEDTTSLPAPSFFTAHIAHAVILGTSIFGIFWGVVNALLVSHSASNFVSLTIPFEYYRSSRST